MTRALLPCNTRVRLARSKLDLRRQRWNSTTSPGSAPSMNTTLPAARATPRPSCASDATCAACASAGGAAAVGFRAGIALPGTNEVLPVGGGVVRERVISEIDLALVLLFAQRASQKLEAQKHQIGIGRIGFAIAADGSQLAALKRAPHLGPIHPELAGEAEQSRHIVQRRGSPWLIQRQQI